MFFVFVFQSAVGRCLFVEHKVISRAICSSARFVLFVYFFISLILKINYWALFSDGFSHKLSEKTLVLHASDK